jgi:hemerythrin-like domain-containing protein
MKLSEEKSTMKRHQQLQSLSREHHNGLLASLLLKKGIAKNADPDTMAAFIVDFWKNDLAIHFEKEETVLLPALRYTSFDENLKECLLKEHKLLRSHVHALQHKEPTVLLINDFAELLEQHIRFEERIFFPEAEKKLTEEQLQQIGEQLKDDETSNCMNYPLKFWE